MQIVYYIDGELGFSPVEEYFKNFLPEKNDTIKITKIKEYVRSSLVQKINFVKDNPGKSAGFLGTVKKHRFMEIKNAKDKDVLIRILYTFDSGKLILLNAFEKPRRYDKTKEKKKIKTIYNKTDAYVDKVKSNQAIYKKYNFN